MCPFSNGKAGITICISSIDLLIHSSVSIFFFIGHANFSLYLPHFMFMHISSLDALSILSSQVDKDLVLTSMYASALLFRFFFLVIRALISL